MRSYQIDPVSGARLVGGEMLGWSDLDRGAVAGAAEVVVRALARGRPTGATLLLGPRAARLLDALPRGGEADVLVRGLPDARSLAHLAQLRPGAAVYCGGIDTFEPEAGYGLVVALDGPAGLCTPDGDGMSHQELLRRLGKWLAPGGTLVVAVENDLGFERLLRLTPEEPPHSPSTWHRGAPGFDDRPPYRSELEPAVASAALEPTAVFAAYPALGDLRLLVSRDVADDPQVLLTAAALAALAEGAHFSDEPAVSDPYDLAMRVFESGMAMSLASGWLVVATTAGAGEDAPGSRADLPALVFTENDGRPEWQVTTLVERDATDSADSADSAGGRWVHRRVPVVPGPERAERRFVRRVDALTQAPPVGLPLEALMRRAASAADVPRVRDYVQRWAGWLQSPAGSGGPEPEARFFATPANVVVGEDERLTVFDGSWTMTGTLPPDVVLARGLRDFARRMLRAGGEHPWSPDISPDGLAETLAAMAGVAWSRPLVESVARLEAELEVVVRGGDGVAESVAYAHNLDEGASQFVASAGPSRGYREAVSTSGKLAQALHERAQQVTWLETSLRSRDRKVGELEHRLSSIHRSVSFRIGRAITWPGRRLVSLPKRVVYSILPPSLVQRGLQVLRKLAS